MINKDKLIGYIKSIRSDHIAGVTQGDEMDQSNQAVADWMLHVLQEIEAGTFDESNEETIKAIIIPSIENGLFTQEEVSYPISGSDRAYLKEKGLDRFESELLGFEVWHKVHIDTVQKVSSSQKNREDW